MVPVRIVIPCYRKEISQLERMSLDRVFAVLGHYPITIVKPESLDIAELKMQYGNLDFQSFPDHYFRGIAGYNRLMLSTDFYSRFSDCEYILIYQLDAYVFSDRLAEWCAKGYDYVGAPWLRRPVYNIPIIKQCVWLSHKITALRGKPTKGALYDKIGNGGLSLRKVASHLRVLTEQRERVDFYLSQKRFHMYNEDVFWATEPTSFKYPTAHEAISFAFDKYPAYCFKLNGGEMPFGCHAWYKRKMRRFWQPIIGF
jgi:hypothetical protein